MSEAMINNLKQAKEIAALACVGQASDFELTKLKCFLEGLERLSERDLMMTREQAE